MGELPLTLLDSSVVVTMLLKSDSWLPTEPPGLLLLVLRPPSMELSENSFWGISVLLRSWNLILEYFPCSQWPLTKCCPASPHGCLWNNHMQATSPELVSIMLYLNLAWAFSSACKKTSPCLLRNFYLCHMHQKSSLRHSSDDHKSLFSTSVRNYILEIQEKVL